MRYINGLRMEIQDEMSFFSPNTMDEAYQCTFKAKEKIARKQNSSRGHSFARGRGQSTRREKALTQKNDVSSSNQQGNLEKGSDPRGGRPS